ncbi:hypothetical protein FH972_012254 [Carpinus fangiana]|uniref:Tubby C-terminal domain-containing protein n=1 Tax=Carpinus fangiana TaxID=176857 RepID=A0A5N6R6D2_9ROSI|nr:hypothetical protein FH972_012254 [Carpinus fangiana]
MLVDSWHVYEGEAGEHCRASKSSEKPIFSIRKQVMMNYSLHEKPNYNVLARVLRGSKNKSYAYVVEGSYAARSCKVVLDGSRTRRVVAEIRRKEASKGGVSFGPEVFVLVVRPGFAPGFAMALVVILDQMYG